MTTTLVTGKRGTVSEIVVGIDGSKSSIEAARWAYAEAALRSSDLRVLCVFQSPAVWLGMGEALGSVSSATVSGEELTNYATETIESVLASITQELKVNVIRDAQQGHPGDVLVNQSRDADLLVLGSKGHSDVGSILVGSVVMHCVHHARSPVVVIPHHKK